MSETKFVVNDGGGTGKKDCVYRAIAIATGKSYQEVKEGFVPFIAKERKGRFKKSGPDSGVRTVTCRKYLASIGWKWVPTMTIGSGCQVHLKSEELPSGRLVVKVSKHLTAVIDGVIHDMHNHDRGGNRCVYGYWVAP